MKFRIILAATALALAATTPSLFAQGSMHHHGHAPSPAMTAAEVRAIDPGTNRITLRHEAAQDAGMPAMTMAFGMAKGLALPAGLKAGDKVQVRIEDVGGTPTVTRLTR
ncbi:MAG: copper-binding protein [Moraxellaceae bacterium]|nr:copper-binding protein [Moraxellaceae bacterium]